MNNDTGRGHRPVLHESGGWDLTVGEEGVFIYHSKWGTSRKTPAPAERVIVSQSASARRPYSPGVSDGGKRGQVSICHFGCLPGERECEWGMGDNSQHLKHRGGWARR